MAVADARKPPMPTLGRFELRKMIGQGAQATVWLAHDPRLDREVAVKVLRDGAGENIGDWLHEARNVSRLAHPNVVPVFEADLQDGRPYMVFEFVDGGTLGEHLKRRGPMPARAAVQMMLGVLDALVVAHAAGLVHRDLKPSNILVDRQERARVMDFGIAARVQERPGTRDLQVVGTPGYMSPEAALGAAPLPLMDVFAAGLVLAEMLSGTPVLRERDPYRALHRVVHEDLALPSSLPADVDDRLRAVLLRAIARDPTQRYSSAATFHGALVQWLHPQTPPDVAGQDASTSSATLDFLLRRMRHKSDFPALSDSVVRIQRIASSELESLSSLTQEILKDVALTNKLLRVVNTAQFTHAGGGSISTVSRAVQLIGFAGIRNMALSLVLLERMNDKAHAQQLKEEFLRSLMAGTLADELCVVARQTEEAFIGAMFQNLGRLLTEFYFPEEARQVRALCDRSTKAPMPEEQAALSVLGISFHQLALGVARHWGLPDALQRCMTRPEGAPSSDELITRDRVRWLATAANDVADAMLAADPADLPVRLDELASRYAKPLGLTTKEWAQASDRARQRLARTTEAMGLNVAPGARARRLLEPGDTAPAATALAPSAAGAVDPSAVVASGDAPTLVLAPDRQAPAPRQPAMELLSAGVQDVTNALASDGFRLNDVLHMILDALHKGLDARRVLLCLRDPKREVVAAKLGVGDGAQEVCASFQVVLRGTVSDLFGAVCMKAADTLIEDATQPSISSRLPPWFRTGIAGPSFLLLPMTVKGAPFGLLYIEGRTSGFRLSERELATARTLRNQAVMAFRQISQ